MILRSRKIYVPYMVEVRWKLIYINKPPIFGMWTRSTDVQEEKASAQCRDGLALAAIEIKDRNSRERIHVVECSAADYVEHRWIAAAPAPTAAPIPVHIQGAIQGMTLLTRDMQYHVFLDGRIKQEPMRERRSNYA